MHRDLARPTRQGEEGNAAWRSCVVTNVAEMYVRNDLWVTNVGEICQKPEVCRLQREAICKVSGSCVDLSQHMKRINQVLLVGRGGDAVSRLSRAAGDLVLPSGHGCLDTGGK